MSELSTTQDHNQIVKKQHECYHFEMYIINSDELLRYYLLIGYLLKTEQSSFLSYLKVNPNINQADYYICIHCQYCADKPNMNDHQCKFNHPFIMRISDFNLICLWCNQVITNNQLQFYRELILHNNSMIPNIPSILSELDLRLTSSKLLLSGFHPYQRIITSNYIGLKGLKNLGKTSSLNCILQLFFHLPFIYTFFLSSFHNPLTCFLSTGLTDDTIVNCFYCCLSKALNELYADNNDSYVLPHYIILHFWTLIEDLQKGKIVTAFEWLDLFIRTLCFPSKLEEDESSYFRSLFSEVDSINEQDTSINTLIYSVQQKQDIHDLSLLLQDRQCLISKQWLSFRESKPHSIPASVYSLPTVLVLSVHEIPSLQFPLQNLTIPFCGDQNMVYDLYGMVCSSFEQMEAMCCVVMINRKWYRFCDEQVFELPELPLSSYNPIILVYVRRYIKNDSSLLI